MVTDGQSHHVVLSGAGSVQTLYLDGAARGSRSGLIQTNTFDSATHVYVGAGFLGGTWPDESHYAVGNDTGYANFFNGWSVRRSALSTTQRWPRMM